MDQDPSQRQEQIEREVGRRTAALAESNVGLRQGISALKTTNRKLIEEKAKLGSLLEIGQVGTYGVDPKGEFVEANTTSARTLGYGSPEALPKTNVSSVFEIGRGAHQGRRWCRDWGSGITVWYHRPQAGR
jgi:PAS domain-containing protein